MKKRNIFALGLGLVAAVSAIAIATAPAVTADAIPEVEQVLRQMTVREKICQMMVSYQYTMPVVDSNGKPTSKTLTATETGANLKNTLAAYPVGGILYDASSIKGHNQLTNLLSTAQSYSKIPLLLPIDEEGGRVARIGKTIGYTRGPILDAMGTYADQGPEKAYSNALFLAQNIHDHGFNMDFAPVADTDSNPANPVIGTRAYSKDFDQAASLIPPAVQGFHDGGVACSLKHFPGHGDTGTDSHTGAAYTYKTLDEIRKNELKPFQAGMDAGADTVMVAHITVDELGVPSLFSKEVVTGLLREEMNFDGVVITDGLGMNAITNYYTPNQTAKMAIDAGCDILLCIKDMPGVIDYLEDAVEKGEIPEGRIDESVRRILTLKYNRGILS